MKKLIIQTLLATILLVLPLFVQTQEALAIVATFTNMSTMSTARESHTATLLNNGKILIVGGTDGGATPNYRSSAELFDPATGTHTMTGSLATSRAYHTATLLPDGKVLITGGVGGATPQPLDSAELYDPAGNSGLGSFTPTGGTGIMTAARYNHTATLLQNGKVLIVGGYNGSWLNSAEIFDPVANSGSGGFSATVGMPSSRGLHTATLLPNGKVLIAGGYDGSNYLNTAELYDPANPGSFSATGGVGMAAGRVNHTATMLPNGKVLLAGGESISVLNSAELYDPAGSGSFSYTASPMTTPRKWHTATLLLDGTVLLVGGQIGPGSTDYLSSAELYDPTAGTFVSAGNMAALRSLHTATPLPDGRVIIAGGDNTAVALSSVEAYIGLMITNAPLPAVMVGSTANFNFAAAGGTGPYTLWNILAGPLPPPGISLSAVGLLSGTFSTVGTYTFTVQVTDSASTIASRPITIDVVPTISISTPTPPGSALVGANYSFTFGATGGIAPLAWSTTSGTLPPGLTLSSAGVLSGIPTTIGSYSFSVQVTDASVPPHTASQTIFMNIAGPILSLFTPNNGIAGTQVTIMGANFDPVPANNLVKFNGTAAPATVTSATANQLTVIVPAGATSGPISVTVGGNTGTSGTAFFTIINLNNIAPNLSASVSDAGQTGNTILSSNTTRKMAVAHNGNIYVVYHGTNGVRVAKSTDKGQTFLPSVQLTATDAEAEVAVNSAGYVYVVWVDSGNAMVSRSIDNGVTFTAPVTVGSILSQSVHMATDGNNIYLVERSGNNFYRSTDGGLTFSTVIMNASQVFSDVHVDFSNHNVIIQMDNPLVKYYVSTDAGATFGAQTIPTPGGNVFYSVGAVSSGNIGRYLFVAGGDVSSDKLRINLADNTSTFLINMPGSTYFNGRSLAADSYGNLVTGFSDGTNVFFSVSNDLGATFTGITLVGNGQQSNAAINPTNGDVMFLYEGGGFIKLAVYSGLLTGYKWPTCDLNGDGKVDIGDALRALKIAVGLVSPTAIDLANGDVAPLVNGKPLAVRKGSINVGDAIVILQKALGIVNW